MDYQPIYNIAKICAAHNITDAVLSPGSRNAPLTYSFVRNQQIKTYTISDERSAGFIALGMSVKSKKPVALICTSGSAVYNFAPAIAEAYYQNVPLIVITADRPPEWIDQLDGQTIKQQNIYGAHVKQFYQSPVDLENEASAWHLERLVNEAIIVAMDGAEGPVHINIPFREPFYPNKKAVLSKREPRIINKSITSPTLTEVDWVALVNDWRKYKNKLIVGGQSHYSSQDLEVVGEFAANKHVPLVGDVLSNMHQLTNNINLADLALGAQSNEIKESLKPDLLITFGKSIISKNIKLFLRKYRPQAHWHIQENGYVPDTYQSLTRIVPVGVVDLLKSIEHIVNKAPLPYFYAWNDLQTKASEFLSDFIGQQKYNELSAIHAIFDNLPIACDIHLANSMPVRWANMYGLDHTRQQVEIFCNRGTSGIDGCTSTALGSALQSDKTTLLITGDMAFFYDRNAFWNKYVPDNLRVIVLNNHGGGIFDIIDGPPSQPEHEEYFLTEQPLSAKAVADEFGMSYYSCKSVGGLSKGLDKFWVRDGTAKILEIETKIDLNTKTFKKLKSELKKKWN
ncbi:MAG: 2-succinyl-5-enolpyruvyl-6-hydroxy-3-cyclohexene-1-carboxylic-acid synthase [Bacteroidota bacterium]